MFSPKFILLLRNYAYYEFLSDSRQLEALILGGTYFAGF
jgi:hypothetical protein